MKKLFIAAAALLLLMITGCKTSETLAKGISNKSISASGVFTMNRGGLDTATQTPELLSLFIWGDYTSVFPGDEIFRYEESESPSIFNKESISKSKKIFFASGDKARMDAVINKLTKKEVNNK